MIRNKALGGGRQTAKLTRSRIIRSSRRFNRNQDEGAMLEEISEVRESNNKLLCTRKFSRVESFWVLVSFSLRVH